MHGLMGQVEIAIMHHCKMHKHCMNKHTCNGKDECNEGVSERCRDFASLLIASFTHHVDPPLVTHILEHASAHKTLTGTTKASSGMKH